MANVKKFDIKISDSQATDVRPISPANFDIQAYEDYENELQERCRDFINVDSGILVYRRTRVAEVFSAGCRDMERSLECQLGALAKSMEFKADIPNFLEPWYGIGNAAASFGIDYIWKTGQAPALQPAFDTVQAALEYDSVPIKDTECGRHTLNMISYFLEKTDGRLPISLCDIQSPLNVICNIVDSTSIYLAMMDAPDEVRALLDKVSSLISDFVAEQKNLLGDTMVSPGHGFPSARSFPSIGLSDDNIIMLSNEMYTDIAAPSFNWIGSQDFNGTSFHSCGNWEGKIDSVRKLENLFMVDGAFSQATDPSPNDPEPFGRAFAGSGIILNARIVGSADEVADIVERIWYPGLKLILTTYCTTANEQHECYERVKRYSCS